MNRRTHLLIALLATLSGHSLAGDAAAESLYERLGGKARVDAIVEATVGELAANSRETFGKRDPQMVKNELVRRICAVSGGGCRYRGPADTGAELVEALRVSMRTHGVPLAARNELLEALAPSRDRANVAALNPRR